MFCKFCKKFGHLTLQCYHRKSRFHSKSKLSYYRKRGNLIRNFKSDKNIKTEPTKITADSNSADQSKEISGSNPVDFIRPIADSKSVELRPITESKSVEIVAQNDDSYSSEEFDNLIKSIVRKPVESAGISDIRSNPTNSQSDSECEMCRNLEHKIKKLKRTAKD